MLVNDTTVFGMYPDFVTLRASVDSLKAFGFRSDDISLLFPECAVSRTLPRGAEPKAPAAAGRAMGPLIGGNLDFLTYIRWDGRGVVCGALKMLGVPADEAKRYEGWIRSGELLVGVQSECTGQTELATAILVETGAHNVWAAANRRETTERLCASCSPKGGRNPQAVQN